MARWEPDARGRLETAAMELFQERGYAHTTVGDIAERAGLTERTFFRYFSDKREVLFSGSKDLETAIVDSLLSATKDAPPLAVTVGAFEAVAARLQAQRDFSAVRARHAIVSEHAEVRERELIKMASLAAAVTKALHARGIGEPAASVIAESGITVFKVGFERWVCARKPGDFAGHIRAAADALRAATASVPVPARARAPRARSKAK
ncbi:MAG TPA: TetR family transcriptional regulator [Polyangiaceae bacterium]|nr:TetR family transcriptional regulator [Polyangiaceae bacterium]